ncbi:MAG: universal stress protein, partial [Verrucomicrobiales bacterium]
MSRERRRILIGLDSSPTSLRGLAAAAEMAARLDAELVGLFVEDDNLLRLARLPQSYEIGMQSARSRNLD